MVRYSSRSSLWRFFSNREEPPAPDPYKKSSVTSRIMRGGLRQPRLTVGRLFPTRGLTLTGRSSFTTSSRYNIGEKVSPRPRRKELPSEAGDVPPAETDADAKSEAASAEPPRKNTFPPKGASVSRRRRFRQNQVDKSARSGTGNEGAVSSGESSSSAEEDVHCEAEEDAVDEARDGASGNESDSAEGGDAKAGTHGEDDEASHAMESRDERDGPAAHATVETSSAAASQQDSAPFETEAATGATAEDAESPSGSGESESSDDEPEPGAAAAQEVGASPMVDGKRLSQLTQVNFSVPPPPFVDGAGKASANVEHRSIIVPQQEQNGTQRLLVFHFVIFLSRPPSPSLAATHIFRDNGAAGLAPQAPSTPQ